MKVIDLIISFIIIFIGFFLNTFSLSNSNKIIKNYFCVNQYNNGQATKVLFCVSGRWRIQVNLHINLTVLFLSVSASLQ